MSASKNQWILVGVLAAFAAFLYEVKGILLPFVAGLMLAYFLNPLATRLEKKRVSRGLGSGLLILSFFVLFVGGFLSTLPFLKSELTRLAIALPGYGKTLYATFAPWIDKIAALTNDGSAASLYESFHEQLSNIATWSLRVIVGLLTNTLALANLISLVVLTPVVAFYVLRDWPLMTQHLENLLPRSKASTVKTLFSRVNTVLAGYVRGQTLVCLSLALYYCVALSLVGLNYSLTIGLVAGLFAFVPYFGFLVAVCAAFGVALTQHPGWMMPGCLAVVFGIGQLIESYFLVPRLVGDRIGLHPVWIIFALLAGGVLFGFVGLLFALPVAAAVGVFVRFSVEAYKKSTLYKKA
jgi:predicted PurR-regulated permease PerM